MLTKPTIDVIIERLNSHIQADDDAWEANKRTLERMEGKLDTACEWITAQKATLSFGKYIAGVMGGVIVLMADKLWK